jgi:drug/metabolite transporter (DMT)-like permease
MQRRLPLPILETMFVLAWSSGFIGARLALNNAPIFLVMFWRFVIVTALLCPFVLQAYRRGALTRRGLGMQALAGALAIFAALSCSVEAVSLGVPLGLAALISSLQPLITAVLAGPILGDQVHPRQWAGLITGFVGVGVAVQGTVGPASAPAYGLLLLATACLVAASLASKAVRDTTPILAALGLQSPVAAALFGLLALTQGSLWPRASLGFAAATAWFIILPTFGGFGLYWLLLRRSPATRVASLIYFTPPVTMVWAWLMFREPLYPAGLLGLAICFLGVALTRQRAGSAQAP